MSTRRDLANAIRFLSIDAVQQANSGHPGMPMGMADIAEVLWNDFLRHNPSNPDWLNRDRFILSNGHGSMLQYSLLHLAGYDLSIDDLKAFRQLHSKTPGHPELGYTPGVEVTTGPLGQGLANAVGLAIAESRLATEFNRPGFDLVDHYTYAFAGDGCLMEGISHEVCSLAGTLGLGKLIVFYDDNGISIDGEVGGWFTDNTPQRFASYNWHVEAGVDGHDPQAIRGAIMKAIAVKDKPTLICCKTTIGFGAPNLAGTAKSHGAALGEAEITATRENLGWSHAPFVVPDAIYQQWDAREKGSSIENEWQTLFAAYQEAHPQLAEQLQRRLAKQLPAEWQQKSKSFVQKTQAEPQDVATRKASELCLEAYGPMLPELFGGSADLSGSNNTFWSGSEVYTPENAHGNYLNYGVREFGMSAIMNGIARHGGMIPYAGTFLVFSDYARNAVRLSAMMQQQVIYVFTHDSIGLGEDGPTHQAIEHIPSLRLIPGLSTWRPCDLTETAVAWQHALENHEQPTCMFLTRQKIKQQQRDAKQIENIARGGYILLEPEGEPQAIVIATGSEVELAVEAATQLNHAGHKVRVVSMPSTNIFDEQAEEYRESVLPQRITARVAVEAASSDYWYKYVGLQGKVIGMSCFGESAPYKDVYREFGITVDNIVLTLKRFF